VIVNFKEYSKKIIPFWKVYTAGDQLTLGTSLNLIDPDCLRYYEKHEMLENMSESEYIWIYKEGENDWSWEIFEDRPDPAENFDYPGCRYEYMGEIFPTKKQIEDYKFSYDVRKYNL
jgi:hypothetical protein